jgi:hypothetical protein
MKKLKLPGFTAEGSLYSMDGSRYANSVGGSHLKSNSVIAAATCGSLLSCCLTGNYTCCYLYARGC